MKTIKASSQKRQMYLDAYRRASGRTSLRDCYRTYSTEKARAERDLRKEMNETGGDGFRILSASRFFFTCGWKTSDGDLRVETFSNSFLVIDD